MELQRRSAPLLWIIAAFAVIYLVWGSTYLAIRIAIETVPPFLMAGVRFLVSALLLAAFVVARGEWRITAGQFTAAAISGLFMLTGANGLVTWAEQTVPSGLAALIVATASLWMVLIDWLGFRGPRPSFRVVLGLFLGISGVGVLVGPGNLLGEAVDGVGALVLLAACLSWSIGSLFSRSATLPASTALTVTVQLIAGGCGCLLLSALTGEWPGFRLADVSRDSIAAMIYLILFGSILALVCYSFLLRVCRASQVATYAYVNPIIAVILGYFVKDEPFGPRVILAGVLIVLGVSIVTSARGKTRDSETDVTPADASKELEPERVLCGSSDARDSA